MNIAIARRSITVVGEFGLFLRDTVRSLSGFWNRRGLFLKQCEYIGVSSMGIIVVAAAFLGAVLGYQLYASFHMFGAEALLGGSIGVSLFRELAPVMTAIMVTGRAGAAMAAELASMRISEQIDALEVMAIDPHEFLVAPRIAAGIVMMPILSIFFGAVGTLMSAVVACGVMDLSYPVFWKQFMWTVDRLDMIHCTLKGATFGFILTWVGCFNGFRAQGGARSVGISTKTTVVVSCLFILFCDYILTALLPFGFQKIQATY